MYSLQNDHRMTYNMYSVYKVDYRGAAAPKNYFTWHGGRGCVEFMIIPIRFWGALALK